MSLALIRVSVASAAIALGVSASAHAQCATCVQPTVAYSPVAQTAYAPAAYTAYSPVVYQTQPRSGWYLGKNIQRCLFGRRNQTVVVGAPAVATTAYRPTFPMSYSAGYAPTSYTVGYASYSPQTYTVGYAPVAAASCGACGCSPCSCTTAYRAVTLSPVTPCCATGCDTCSGCSSYGAVTAGYDALGSSTCSSCAGGATATYLDSSPAPQSSYDEPTPAIAPQEDVPQQRSLRPESAQPEAPSTLRDDESDALRLDSDSSNAYFEAPRLFNPQDRTTQRPTAPVWTAVYRKESDAARPSTTSARHRSASAQEGASGWRSASN